jgi:predicted helicase
MPDELINQTFKLKDTRGWKLTKARRELAEDENWDKYFASFLYRPFDLRHIYYTQKMVDWPRPEVMPNMIQNNLGLIAPKQFKEEPGAFVTQTITGHKTVSAYDINYLFPLYLYPTMNKKDLFSHGAPGIRQPNISTQLIAALSDAHKKPALPEELFYYIYAVLYSNIYRTKYAEFLRTDFPRIPFTKDYKLFSGMGKFGKTLVDLHLLKSKEIDPPVAKFKGKGENKVGKVTFKEGRISINKDQYFEGIAEEIWQYQIGGYQVCDKWLKDRKGQRLSLDDIKHYCKVVTAIGKTIEIQKAIDKLYPEIEKEIIEFKSLKTKQ